MVEPLRESASQRPDGAPVARRQPLVLLAEDDSTTAEMYRIGLEAAGFRVRIAPDVTAVFAAIEREIPDVAVLDYHLSGIITGVDILENIRLDIRAEYLPVLILSNDAGVDDGAADRAREAGAWAWLRKHDTNPLWLAMCLSEVVANHNARSSSWAPLLTLPPRIVGRKEGRGRDEHKGPAGVDASHGDGSTGGRVDAGGLEGRSQ